MCLIKNLLSTHTVLTVCRAAQEAVASQGRSQDFLKGFSKNGIELLEQGSGGTAPSHRETLNILVAQNSTDCYIFNVKINCKADT